MLTRDSRETFRFGDFELDIAAYELRRKGRAVHLERQPMDVLILLVERRGVLVTRAEIVDRLWGRDVFVDVETGVHTAIRKIRQALRDSRDDPVFIETVAGRGYRFIAAVEVLPVPTPTESRTEDVESGHLDVPEVATTGSAAVIPADDSLQVRIQPQPRARTGYRIALAFATLMVIAIGGVVAWKLNSEPMQSRVTLAVLPFENLGRDAERDYLADGLTDETGAVLSQIDPAGLSVKGRTARYRGTTKTAAEIGQELSVDYLVEGSIREEGGQVRVTAKLIRVRDQEYVWSKSYERAHSSLLGLQQELSLAIAEQIRLRLSPDRANVLRDRHSGRADAYDAYLRARYFENRRNPEGNARAVEHYRRAVTFDPNYALAWSGLAMTYAWSVLNADARPIETWDSARKAAKEATRAQPNLPEALFVSGYLKWLADWDWVSAESAFRRVIEFDPSSARAHLWLGHVLSQAGRHGEAELSMRTARELDPLAVIGHALSSQVAFQARQYRSAIEHARRAIQLDSEFWIGHMMLGQAYEQLGERDVALEALADATRFSAGNSKPLSLNGYTLARAGRFTEARELLRMLDETARKRYMPPYAMALVHAGLDERDVVFEWLDRAYVARDAHLIFLTTDPKWDAFRADPRFVDLLARCGFLRP
jgi:TolB-like protein/DNA-binding winged helix-turn-helix (wHTH) protein/Flp pilus assembly protein TadD